MVLVYPAVTVAARPGSLPVYDGGMKRALLALLLGACGNDSAPPADAFDPNAPHVMATLTPETIAPGGTFALTVTAENFTLEAITGQPNAVGHGHFHVFLDDIPDYIASDAFSPRECPIPADTVAGTHRVKIQLVNNDHSTYMPESFTVISLGVN